MSLKKIIKNKNKNKKRFTWKGVEVFIKDDISDPNISVKKVLDNIGSSIPRSFLVNVDTIYVGNFDFFKDRQIQAMYENSCIFVTNEQDSIEDMCDDIVHEIAHSLEEVHKEMIYSDGKIEKEFLDKRKQLYSVLKSEGFEVELMPFMEPAYKKEFDEYLYKGIGYSALNMLSTSIFYSPYAATSIREYFANGFEALYYYRDFNFINKACPVLFNKLMKLGEIEHD
jgi:hypothetical protein